MELDAKLLRAFMRLLVWQMSVRNTMVGHPNECKDVESLRSENIR